MLAPGETTFFRLLKNISPEKLQEKLLACLDHLLGSVNPRRIIIDGNELRSSQGLQLVSTFCGETGRFLGARAVEEKSDEIPAARELLKECGGDYFRLGHRTGALIGNHAFGRGTVPTISDCFVEPLSR